MSANPIPISKTKIIVPHRRPELLSRPRLLERLTTLLDNKLLLLSAPAGYGKTSLMIDLAQHVEIPVCWLSLDLLDRDPQRFLAYLIASLAERFNGVGETSRLRLNQLRSIEEDAEPILVMLTNELYDHAENDFLLVLDDYHLLDDTPIISSLLNRFLQLVDENCHILLSSRTLPELDDVTLMVAREQVAGISHAELAFVPREVQALYVQNYRQHLSDESAGEIVQQTGGWITGMVLSSLPGVMRVSGVDTFAYLGNQVLDQQPEQVREFLMRTSLPEEFNTDFCELMLSPLHSGLQNWSALMGLILEKNLFVLPLGEDGRWLRYHPLFREFLQTRLKAERPQEVEPILQRMVTAYEKSGEWEKAYFTCKQLDDLDALAGVIERSGTSMLQNALVTLEGWINSLPPSIVVNRPGLISLRGPMLAMKGNLQESNNLLDTAVALYKKSQDVGGLTLALTRRAHTLRLLGNYHASLADIKEALRLAESNPLYQPLYAEALRIKGLNLYRLGESRQAVDALEHSLSLYTALKETGSIPMLLMETGMVYRATGNTGASASSYQEALKIWQKEKNYYSQAEILNNLGVLYQQLGEYELASEAFENGLGCARKSRNQRVEALILTSMGDLYGEIEEFEAAISAYQQADLIASSLTSTFISNYLVLAKGNLALLKDDLSKANEVLGIYRKKRKASQSHYERGLWTFFEGRYRVLNGEYTKAIRLLQECKTLFTQDGRDLEIHASIIWLAAAYGQAGQHAKAYTEFDVYMETLTNPSHALITSVRQAAYWLNGLQDDTRIGRTLNNLIEKSRSLTQQIPAIRRSLRRHAQSIQMSSAYLNIRAFGRAEVKVQGRSVTMSEWRTQSVRDLFFYFLYKQEALTKEQIGVVLWPEIGDPQLLKARFKNEIYRLRRAISRDIVVFEDEYYRFNHALDYEYDVDAFEAYLLRARKATDRLERIEYFQRAVDIAEGDYLSDVDSVWAHVERERLGQLYVAALEELAKLYLDENRLALCLSVCQQVLNRDRYNELIYQIEMRAYAALGDRSAIARLYRACKAALNKDLGIALSRETEDLFHELTL